MIQQQRTLSKTKAFILSLPDGGERIFRSYGIDTGTNAKQELPIGGKGGVFSDYDGVIRVHRFSTGEKFDVVGLVMNAERCDYRAARDRIAAHYNTTAAKIQESASQMLTTGQNDTEAPITIGQKRSLPISRVLAEIRFREYTQSEREYLNSKTAGIVTPEALQSFGVRGVDMVHEITAEGKDRKQTGLAHYFAFPSGTRGYTKLVTPKRTTRDGERIKSSFVTNVEGYAERSGGKGYAFGLNEITGATSAAIIAEGEWETCILKSLGFDAFTKGGVDSCAKLTEHEIGILRAKNITRVVALFDNDHAGHTAAATFTKQRIAGIECIAVVWPCGEHVKDLCDYVQLFGFDERIRTAIDSALTMQTPDRFTFTRRGVTIEAQSYKVDKYVSEVSNDIDTQLRRRKRIVLSAPTGSGKTTLALNLAQDYHRRTGKRAAIVLPTQIGVAQLTNDAARARDVAGNEWHVETIGVSSAEGFDELARSRAFAAKVIVSTYDSIDTIGEDIGFLVIDEGHTFAGDYSYRPKAIEKVFTAMSSEHVEQILGLSATPETLFCKMYGFDVIRCTAAEQVRYDVSFSTYESANALAKYRGAKVSRRDSLISHIVGHVTASVRAGKRAVVRYNDKKEIEKIAAAIRKLGIGKVYVVSSDVKADNAKNAAWLSIVERRKLPDDCAVLLSTKTLDTAVSIGGQGHEIFIVNETNADAVAQFVARFRDEQQVRVWNIYHKFSEHQSGKNAAGGFNRLCDRAEVVAAFLNLYGDGTDAVAREVHNLMRAAKISAVNEDFRLVRRGDDYTWRIDEVYCYAKAVKDATESTADGCREVLESFVSAGIMNAEFVDAITANAEDHSSEVAAAIEETNGHHEAMRDRILTEIERNHSSFLPAVYESTQDRYLRGEIPQIAGSDQFSIYRGVDPEYKNDVAELLSFSDCAKIVRSYCTHRGNLFNHTAAVALLRNPKHVRPIEWLRLTEAKWCEIDARGKMQSQLIERFRGAFVVGESYTGAEIQAIATEQALDQFSISPKLAVSLFKTLFGCSGRSGKAKKYHVRTIQTSAGYCQDIGIDPPAAFVGIGDEVVGDTLGIKSKILRTMCHPEGEIGEILTIEGGGVYE